ncbi:MAG: flagellar motor switch phosphatase FliY [Clostridia bacterium]|nr:flagellar motor switch phosphatase FliY [Clostridia bacterium]
MPDMLSQEEIDALLSGGDEESAVTLLSDDDKDILGEIGNISMGTAATTLFTLLGQKVTITTPRVSETDMEQLSNDLIDPCVLINIKYIEGIQGLNMLVLHEKDVKIITDLMMGGDGTNIAEDLTDLHLSAISEAMNQMIGSSSTSLSEMLAKKIDISPPEAIYESISDIDLTILGLTPGEHLVKTSFNLTVGDLIDSEIMQILPLDVSRQLVDSLMSASGAMAVDTIDEPEPQPAPPEPQPMMQQPMYQQPQMQQAPPQMAYQMPPQGAYQQPQMPPPGYGQPMQQPAYQNPVNVQAFQYENFDASQGMSFGADIGLIKDVPLEITVELGRTSKQISEILDFGVGTVIELDRLVGESLDILANGKKIAKGEVVVVDENYGIRITDIIVPEKRMNNM